MAPACVEPLSEYHSSDSGVLTWRHNSVETVSIGQFDWGGRLLKGNGGVQRFPSVPVGIARKRCKGRRGLTARHTCQAGTKNRA